MCTQAQLPVLGFPGVLSSGVALGNDVVSIRWSFLETLRPLVHACLQLPLPSVADIADQGKHLIWHVPQDLKGTRIMFMYWERSLTCQRASGLAAAHSAQCSSHPPI